MTTRYRGHDRGDVSTTQDSAPLDLVSPHYTMPKGDNESFDEYNEENDTCHALL